MEVNRLYIDPYTRVFFLVASIIGTLLVNNTLWYLFFYFMVIFPIFIYSGQFKKHFQLLAFGIFPIFLSFALIYIVILKGMQGDWDFIYHKTMTLIIITSCIQLSLLIPSSYLITTLKKWKLKGESLITVLGAFTVWADILNRTQKILTARFSRGFIKKRTIIQKIWQFPFVLVPLITGVLRTSTERASSWEEKDILYLVDNFEVEERQSSIFLDIFSFSASLLWLCIGIYLKLVP